MGRRARVWLITALTAVMVVGQVPAAAFRPIVGSPTATAAGESGTVAPSSLSYGNVAVGASTQAQVVVTNTGASSWISTSFAFTGANPGDWTVVGCGSVVAPAASCSLTVTFTPQGTGPRAGSLAMSTSNAATIPTVALSGAGVLRAGTYPRGIAVNASTHRAYVANWGSANVTVIDAGTAPGQGAVVATVAVGSSPFDVAVNATTNRIYVANQGSNTISVIDGATNLVTGTIAVGSGPTSVAVNPLTNTVYVGNNAGGGNTVSVVNGATGTLTSTITVPGFSLSGVAVNAITGRLYVITNSSPEALHVVDAAGSVVATVALASGSNPSGVAVNESTDQIWIPTSTGATVVNGATNTVAFTVLTGGHNHIALNTNANRAYLGTGGPTVSAIDGALRTAYALPAGAQSTGVGVDTATGYILASQYFDGTVAIIRDPRLPGPGDFALHFNGAASYLTGSKAIANSAAIHSAFAYDFTIDTWVKWDGSGAYGGIVSLPRGIDREVGTGITLALDHGYPFLAMQDQATNLRTARTSVPLTPHRWTHIVASYDGWTTKITSDGANAGGADYGGCWPVPATTNPLLLGTEFQNLAGLEDRHFGGAIDDLIIKQGVASPTHLCSEIRGPAVTWSFNEGTGTVARATSGGPADANLYNGVTWVGGHTSGPVISGLVRGPFEGQMVAGVTVEIRNGPSGALEGSTTTDSNGRYSVPVNAGSHYVFFTPTDASGLAPIVYPNGTSGADAQAVVVTDTDKVNVNVTLSRGYAVSGQVRDAAGASLANVSVQVFLGDRCCYAVRETKTNSDGFYRMYLSSGASYRMRAGVSPNDLWWNGVPNPGETTAAGWRVATPFRMETTTSSCAAAESTTLINNWNADGVLGGGAAPSFTTPGGAAFCVTEIDTYHLATGIGARGGTITLRGPRTVGPLAATATGATPGFANWSVSPRVGTAIVQGTTDCIDSDTATWAKNIQSGGFGFCKVYGVPLNTTTTAGDRPNTDFIFGTAGGLTGIAQCGSGALSLAKVQLLSGKTVVATTTADESGSFWFPRIAPNTAFTLRYTSAYGLITCVAGVTTGSGTVVPPPSIPNLHNSTWPTAFRLNGEGTAQTDYLAVPRSAWFKVTIAPSQQIVVSLRNCAFDCSLVLYTDIQQAAVALAAQTIASGQRQIAPAELSPAELSPAELSPAELSPAELSPAELSPAELSPAELSPAELSPAELSPAELSPAELSPAELSALAYSSAQTKSILAVSAHAGLSPELIVRNTWEHTGDFYIRVLSHDGTTSTQPFTVSARVLPGACVGVNLTKVPSTLTASAATSIILTNTSRLTDAPATATAPAMTVAQFVARLNRFATKNGAKVIDLAQDTGIQANYANWDAHPACALAANTVADSIHDLIAGYRAIPGLRYITLAGSDRVIPFRRVPDLAGLGNESTYHVPVLDASQSAAALHSGYFLSQDYYAAPSPILRGNLRIDLATEAIGRIVESLTDMTAMLDAYDGVGGVAKPKTAVSTGYDFIADLANELKTTFQAEGLTVDTLIEAAGLKATDPSAWNADQLRAFLFGAKAYGIYAINGHFSGNRLLAADYATLIGSEEVVALPASDTRYRNALILSMGCHAGYNIVDGDAIPNATQPVGWVEAFNARGATVVGSTGYGYADTDFVQYSELILSKTATALGIGPAPVAIGDALRDAKSSYLSSLAAPEGIDAKAAAEATVYGLPFMKFDVARPSSASGETPLTLANGTSAGLQYGTPVLSYVLNQHTTASVPVAGSTNHVNLTYYDASGDIQVSPLQPVLPRNVTRLALPPSAVLRGGVLFDARYTEVSPIFPQTDAATTETRGQLPTAFASVYTPLRLFALNQIADHSLVVLPLQYLTDGVTGRARLYDAGNLHLRLYTSTRSDASAYAAAPSISNVVLTPIAGGVHVDAVIGGLTTAGIEDVLFTYTNGADPVSHVGNWTSATLRGRDLAVDRREDKGDGFAEHVSGDILTPTPFDLRLFVQAVSGNAQVSVSSNLGAYFQLDRPSVATVTAPKHQTALAFIVRPASSTTYGGSISTTVKLTDGTTPIDGKPINFEFGGHRVRAITAGGGLASAHFAASFNPAGSPYTLTAAFAEDQDLLGSTITADVAITRAASSLGSAGVTYTDSAQLGATLSASGKPLHEELVTITIMRGTTVVATRPVQTNGTGRAQTDISGLPDPGATPYTANFSYAGSDFFEPGTATLGGFTPAISVIGAGYLGGDKKTTFELGVVFARQGGDGDERGTNDDQRGGNRRRGNNNDDNKPAKKPVYKLSGGFKLESKTAHLEFESVDVRSVTVAGGHAELSGTGRIEDSSTVWLYRLVVVDGTPDTFELSIWDGTGSLANPKYHVGPATVTGQVTIR